jgi:hypothetical protein
MSHIGQHSYSITPSKESIREYLIGAIQDKDFWIIIFPTETAEHVIKILMRLPGAMLICDNGKPEMWVCAGIDMMIPLANLPEWTNDDLALAATIPRDAVPPEAIARVFNIPTPADNQSMIALCQDPEKVPVPLFFLEALRVADPESAQIFDKDN